MRTPTILIAVCLLLAGCQAITGVQSQPTYQASLPLVEKPNTTPEAALPTGQIWQIEPQMLDASLPGGNFSIRINSPLITGEAAAQHAAFNQEVQRRVEEWRETYTSGLMGTPTADIEWFVDINYQVTSAANWMRAIPFAISSYMEVERPPEEVLFLGGHALLSILFEDFAYLGGAHPGTHYSALTYNATTGQVLRLEELFQPESDYLGLLSSMCIAELQTRQALVPAEVSRGAAPKPENYQTWAITPHGLLLVFQEYQVGPYAAGAQTVLIPYASLAARLDPAGPLSAFAK